jgi:hypothetical protein
MDELLQVQSKKYIKLQSTIQKKKITLGKDKHLRKQINKYTNNIITRVEFVKFLSFRFYLKHYIYTKVLTFFSGTQFLIIYTIIIYTIYY